MVASGAPAPGQIIWLDFSPTSGTEQAGRRPALVLSDRAYNERSGRAVVAPITGRIRGWSFEAPLPDGSPVSGVVLADQLRTVDWRARGARLADHVAPAVLEEVRAKIAALIGLQ